MAKVATAKSATKKQQKQGGGPKLWLKNGGEERSERRFVPKTSATAVGGTLATSLGAVAVGAGVFARFVSNPPHDYAIYLLGGGGLLALVGLFSGSRASVVRVGDAGIAVEKDPENVERLAWYDVDAIRLAQNSLSFSGNGRVLSISTVAQPDAAALALEEARTRIPARVTGVSETLASPSRGAGQPVKLEPLQLAGLRCKKSERIIAVEKDGRFCARCGQTYHKEAVPRNCLSCDARLA